VERLAIGGIGPSPQSDSVERIVRTSGSALDDALIEKTIIGLIPKVDFTLAFDALELGGQNPNSRGR
jgi:hypothetical protein